MNKRGASPPQAFALPNGDAQRLTLNASVVGAVIAALVALVTFSWVPLAAIPLLPTVLWAALRAPAITLGAEGVLVRTWGPQRYIPFSRILAIRTAETVETTIAKNVTTVLTTGWIVFSLEGGKSLSLFMWEQRQRIATPGILDWFLRKEPEAVRTPPRDGARDLEVVLFAALRTAHLAWKAKTTKTLGTLEALADDAWTAGVREIAQGSADYRHATTTDDELIEALATPIAPGTDRIAAAYALRRRAPEEHRERIRVAAEVTVDPDVKRSLERLADADEEECESIIEDASKGRVTTRL